MHQIVKKKGLQRFLCMLLMGIKVMCCIGLFLDRPVKSLPGGRLVGIHETKSSRNAISSTATATCRNPRRSEGRHPQPAQRAATASTTTRLTAMRVLTIRNGPRFPTTTNWAPRRGVLSTPISLKSKYTVQLHFSAWGPFSLDQ